MAGPGTPRNAMARARSGGDGEESLRSRTPPSVTDRVVACLEGIATGDAIGKQTEMLSHADVRQWYPDGIRGFEGTPGAVIPRDAGNRKREWRIGEATDDTERTLAVARAIIADGGVSHVSVAREMLACTKSVHPGVKSLWEFHQARDPERVVDRHDGCGAAIRAAPVGIFYPSDSLDDLVRGAREASVSTHGGPLAIAAAAANAAAVSAAIDGAGPEDVFELALRAATMAQGRWPGAGAPSLADAMRAAHECVSSLPEPSPANIAERCFPNQPLTIVPLALALAAVSSSAEEAILVAANVGGDSDSVASIAGGILGAMHPDTVNEDWSRTVEAVNGHGLTAVAEHLARIRRERSSVL